jgi:hypothetical protein
MSQVNRLSGYYRRAAERAPPCVVPSFPSAACPWLVLTVLTMLTMGAGFSRSPLPLPVSCALSVGMRLAPGVAAHGGPGTG